MMIVYYDRSRQSMVNLEVVVQGEEPPCKEFRVLKGRCVMLINGIHVTPEIIEKISGAKFAVRIHCAESGGGYRNTGHSTVVCSAEDGNRLRPYRVLHAGQLACSEHAFFSVNFPIAEINVTHGTETRVTITKYSIDPLGTRVIKELVWHGEPDDLPNKFAHFGNAVEAGVVKSKCYHCRHVHYAIL